jgi:hypothetical protein
VVDNNNLSSEGSGLLSRVILSIRADISTTDIFHRHVLDVETNIVSWNTFSESLVVHFDRLDFSGDGGGGEGDNHAGLDGSRLDTTDGDRTDTTNLVDILEGETEGLVHGTAGGFDGVDGLQESLTGAVIIKRVSKRS